MNSLHKTSLCKTYEKKKQCPWGDNCIFAHGTAELRPLPKWFEKRFKNQKIGEASASGVSNESVEPMIPIYH